MKYYKLFFSIIFIFNLFTFFFVSGKIVKAEIYTCKQSDGACYGSYDTTTLSPDIAKICMSACGSTATCVLYNSSTGCVDQTRTAPDVNMPKLQIPDLNVKFSAPTDCGVDAQGNKILCIDWIAQYIAGVYKYAIGIVGILAAVVLMIGGVIWIMAGGNATMIGEAKAWIGASLAGLVIALCSYLILYQINPALTIFHPLQITQVKKIEPTVTTGSCSWTKDTVILNAAFTTCGDSKTLRLSSDDSKCGEKTAEMVDSDTQKWNCCCQIFGGKCQPGSGNSCDKSQLTIFGDKADQASAICQGESNASPGVPSGVDICADGNPASWGLFQINITAHSIGGYNCPDAFSGGAYTSTNHSCRVINPTLYNNCVNAAKNPITNIQKAYEIYSSSGGWSQWGFYNRDCKSYF